MRGGDGRVAIPRGTEFMGRITQVQAAKRPQREATLTVVFETMRMPYGVEKIATVVTAIDGSHDEIEVFRMLLTQPRSERKGD